MARGKFMNNIGFIMNHNKRHFVSIKYSIVEMRMFVKKYTGPEMNRDLGNNVHDALWTPP